MNEIKKILETRTSRKDFVKYLLAVPILGWLTTNASAYNVWLSGDQLLSKRGATNYRIADEYFGWFKIAADDSWDSELTTAFVTPNLGCTVIDVLAWVEGSSTPTLTFNLEKRTYGSLGSTGTNLFSSNQTATQAGATLTPTTTALSANDVVFFKTDTSAQSGTVSMFNMRVRFRINKV